MIGTLFTIWLVISTSFKIGIGIALLWDMHDEEADAYQPTHTLDDTDSEWYIKTCDIRDKKRRDLLDAEVAAKLHQTAH